MADRWMHDRGRSEESRRQRFEPDYGRDRWGAGGGYEYGGGGARGQEERSFRGYDNDRDDERGSRTYGGQGYGEARVFGERESGASYGQGQAGYGGQGYGAQGGRYYGDPGRGGNDRSRFGEEPRFGGYESDYGRRSGFGGVGGRYASQGGGDLSTGYEADRYRGGGRDWSAGDAGYSRYAGGYQDRDSDRGFFERAGERISSWFGDDNDDRRQRGRHYGRGPSGYKRSDARISEDIHDRLTDDDELDASTIQVEVNDGEVTLSGTVAEREDKHRAERLAERVTGVGHVQNNLRVDPSLSQTGSHLFGGAFAADERAARTGRQDGVTTASEQVKSISDGKN
jgi:osmotically-inducible protein OsmY